MPIFEIKGGKQYTVKDENVAAFAKKYPDAVTRQDVGNEKYWVEAQDYNDFLQAQQPTEEHTHQQQAQRFIEQEAAELAQQQAQSQQQPVAQTAQKVEYPVSTLADAPQAQTPQASESVQPQADRPLTDQEKAALTLQNINRLGQTRQSIEDFNTAYEDRKEYSDKTNMLNLGQAVKSNIQLNPETGEVEQTYLTPYGNRYTDKTMADAESVQYRDTYIKPKASVKAQLTDAYKRLEELEQQRKGRANEADKEAQEFIDKKFTGLGRLLAGGEVYRGMTTGDSAGSALDVAIADTKETIRKLEEQRDREKGKDPGFWQSLSGVGGKLSTWDFGMTDMMHSSARMASDFVLNQKEDVSESERAAYEAMLEAAKYYQQVEAAYGGNANFWYRAGEQLGHSLPFMRDFMLMNPATSGAKLATKGAAKLATKAVGKEAAEQMAKQGVITYVKNNGWKGAGRVATDWTIKALGQTADDMLVRVPLMMGTVGAPKVMSDAIDLKLGEVVTDEQGNLSYDNSETWGYSLWQSGADNFIEYLSEMSGELFPSLSMKSASDLAGIIGAKRIGNLLAKADAGALSGIAKTTYNMLNKMGMQGYVGEVGEEYYGQALRSLLGLESAYTTDENGNRINLFQSGQFHGDLWGGMAITQGMLRGTGMTMTGARYTALRHGVSKADSKASKIFGQETWDVLRDTIDNTTNEDIGAMAEAVMSDKTMTEEQKQAATDYIWKSLEFRGFNLATNAQSRGSADEDAMEADESYLEGYHISTPEEMKTAKHLYSYHRQRMKLTVGANEEALDDNAIDWIHEAQSARQNGNEQRAEVIMDFVNAKQLYEGMIQRVRDDIDGQIETANTVIDSQTNRDTGKIEHALMKIDDRSVHIIKGKVVLSRDGRIDHSASDSSIIIRDEKSGQLEQVSPDAISMVDESIDPSEYKEISAQAIRQRVAQEAADNIDGKVTFNEGDIYTLVAPDGTQTQVTVTANEQGQVDNGDGTVNVSDGNKVVALPKEVIQQQVDAQEAQTVQTAEEQRQAENEAARQSSGQQQPVQPQREYRINDNVTLRDENGNTIRGEIASVDKDGIVVDVDVPINGQYAAFLTREQLDGMLIEHNGESTVQQAEPTPAAPEMTVAENATVEQQAPIQTEQSGQKQNIRTIAPRSMADEERQQRGEMLRNAPAIDVKENQIVSTPDLSARKVAERWWDTNVSEPVFYDTEVGEVEINRNSVESSLAHRYGQAKLDAITSLVEGFENAVYLGTLPDSSRQEGVLSHYFAYPINYKGKRNYVFCRAMQDANKNRLYVHEVFVAENIKTGDTLQTAAFQPHGGITLYRSIIGNVLKVPTSSQNGESSSEGGISSISHADESAPAISLQSRGDAPKKVQSASEAQSGKSVSLDDLRTVTNADNNSVPLGINSSELSENKGTEIPQTNNSLQENQQHPQTAFDRIPKDENGQPLYEQTDSDTAWDALMEQTGGNAQMAQEVAESMLADKEDALKKLEKSKPKGGTTVPEKIAAATERKAAIEQAQREIEAWMNIAQTPARRQAAIEAAQAAQQAVPEQATEESSATEQQPAVQEVQEQTTPEQQQTEIQQPRVSQETDENGLPFMLASDGTTTFGNITEETGLSAAPIKLSEGFAWVDSKGANHGYGFSHIEASHGEQIRKAGFGSVADFVESIAKGYQVIKKGNKRKGGDTYLLEVSDGKNNTLFIELSSDGSYWNVNSAGIFRKGYSKGKEVIWSLPAFETSPTAGDLGVRDDSNPMSGNSPQITSSEGKDTETSQIINESFENLISKSAHQVEIIDEGVSETGNSTYAPIRIDGKETNLFLYRTEPAYSTEEPIVGVSFYRDDLTYQEAADLSEEYNKHIGSEVCTDANDALAIIFGNIDEAVRFEDWLSSRDKVENTTQTNTDFVAPERQEGESVLDYAERVAKEHEIHRARKKVNTNPTESQKKAGNYRKGHIEIDGFDITIENPKGSVRSGVDANGQAWETTMQNDYGYIRGSKSKDGDQIDVFFSEHPTQGDVFVIDQVNPETGEFDEHKVMYGFNSEQEAREAYLANYTPDWKGLGSITQVSKADFKKWVESSNRKIKPFAEYKKNGTQKQQTEKTDVLPLSQLNKGRKWEETGKPTRARYSRKNHTDSTIFIGKKRYGATTAESETISSLAEDYHGFVRLWNAYEAGEIFLSANEAAIVKKFLEDNFEDAPLEPYHVKGNKKAQTGNTVLYRKGETVNAIQEANARFNEELKRYQNGEMDKNDMFHLGNPQGAMSLFLPNLPIVMRQGIVNKASNTKHNVGIETLKDLPQMISEPIFVFQRSDNALGVLTEIKDRDGKNVCVAIELNKKIQDGGDYLEVNDVRSIHGRDASNLILPIIHNNTLAFVDKEKGLAWLSSASYNYQQEIDKQDLVSATKIVEEFENPTIPGEQIRNRSNEREKKDESNYYIDNAISLFTGRTIGEARQMRLENEQKRRDLAKEIYDAVLKNEYNDVLLQQIDDYIDDATPDNPYGRRISQRLPQKSERRLQKGHRTNAVDALYTRIAESTVGGSGKKLAGNRSQRERTKEKKKELLKQWAIATGNWHTSISDFTDDTEPIARGKDSDVYNSKEEGFVVKFSKGKSNTRFSSDIDAVNLFNYVFPSTAYSILGYGEIGGQFVTILRQPIISTSSALTEDERVEYMRSHGFEPINYENTAFSNGDIVVSDLQKANVVRGTDGKTYVIDADVKLHTKDVGGNYTYPPASVDTENRNYDDEVLEHAESEPQQNDTSIEEQNSDTKPMATSKTRAGRNEMAKQVRELAERLNLDNVEVVTLVSSLEGEKATAKGFYNPQTGKISVVIPNNTDVADAIQTLLHEAVAHYGLRQMFGKHFDTFLDNVYENAEIEVRRAIVDLAKNNGWHIRIATEEYLASLAEKTNFEQARDTSWWQKIKDFFMQMLEKLGMPSFRGAPLSDNELRYILWRSYENLKESKYDGIFAQAADIAKQYELGVGKYRRPKAERIEKLRNSKPVEITGKEIEPSDDLRQYRKNAQKYGLDNLRGEYTNKDTGHEIKVSKTGIKEATSHNTSQEQFQSVAAIPQLLEDSIYIESVENEDLEKNKEVSSYDYYVCGLRIGDADYTVKVVIANGTNGVRYYDHHLTEIEKGELISLLTAIPNHGSETNSPLSGIKDKRLVSILQDRGENVLYRQGSPEAHERALARERYEQRVRNGWYQSREALQDSMLSLREAMLLIAGDKKSYIEDIAGFENAYLGENRLSSVNKAEADAFAYFHFKPLLDEVAGLAKTDEQRQELTDYMFAKHGLERNRVMAERDAKRDFEAYIKQHPDGGQTLQGFIDEHRQRDYAGLTALTGIEDVAAAELEAERMVAEYESIKDTAELWERVNATNKAILSKSYESGMMSKETYEDIKGMYEYYIPLRGFDQKTSAEAYAYLNDKHSAFNAPYKKAEGRKSKADDPFAYMQNMAESVISQGNRNTLVKQKFLNFVLNHPSDLVSVNKLWVQYDEAADEWKPVFPDNIDETDNAAEVERKMQEFEGRMKKLAEAEPDKYKSGRDAASIPYKVVTSNDLHQHQVVVKRNGVDYVLTVNGNPRLAQALNGLTNPDNDITGAIGAILGVAQWTNRQLSALYTTRNPNFVASNFMRDMLYSNTMAWVKETPNYARRFNRNFAKFNPATMTKLLTKHRNGTLDMNNKTEALFHNFIMNGGETGYTNIRDIEKHKNDINRELRKANGKLPVRKAFDLLGERLDDLNRAVENCARFAAFVTSREMGRTIERSIYDAKEISVNFNKKGSGAKFMGKHGQTVSGNSAAFISGLGRLGYVFWNAAIQGTTNFGRQFKRRPAKAFTSLASLYLLGAIVAYLGGEDDDEDDSNSYYNLPDYVRRSNLLFRSGDHWISIPLPIEYRAIYGMGELMMSTLNGKEHLSDAELAEAIAGQVTQILPLDILEGGGGFTPFIPSSVKPLVEAYVTKKDWIGMPIYKDNDWNKNMPEWTKAYSSTNKHIVGLYAALNEATGGDKYTKGRIDWNPAITEHLLESYFSGYWQTIDQLGKTAATIVGAREFDARNILILNRVMKSGSDRTEYRAVNNEYNRLKDEYEITKQRLRGYENEADLGILKYVEKIDFLYNSPEYERYEIFKAYKSGIDALYNMLKEVADEQDRKEIEAELNELKKEMIAEMEHTYEKKRK